VRLSGRIDAVDLATGEVETTYSTEREPDGTRLKCCGNRREAVCPSCAERYRGDAFQLVVTGLGGGKGVPESVREHPVVFVTLTAPSFGPVHSRRMVNGVAQRCRPRRRGEVCHHGMRLSCGEVHREDDPRLGEPLCAECFDYEHAVLWNALVPELWRRTAIQIPRELARAVGVSERELRRRARVSYVKVADYQQRGALHFHCVVRLDHGQVGDDRAASSRPRGNSPAGCSGRRCRPPSSMSRWTPPLPSTEAPGSARGRSGGGGRPRFAASSSARHRVRRLRARRTSRNTRRSRRKHAAG
jgi:hypothetical protein